MKTEATPQVFDKLDSPLGEIWITGNAQGLQHISFPEQREKQRLAQPSRFLDWQHQAGSQKQAVEQLKAYFGGELTDFSLALAPAGTEFQKAVWHTLCQIPFGKTVAYSDIANRINRPKAVRAVGAANGANPLPIVVPCHRIIGKSGQLTGYAGGLHLKTALLELEGVISRR